MVSEGATGPAVNPRNIPFFQTPCLKVREPGFIEEFLNPVPTLLGLPKVDYKV